MPLPFLAGLAAGAALTLLYTKRDEVKKIVDSPAFQDNLQKGKEFSQKTFNNIKDKFEEVSPKIKSGAKKIFTDFKDNVGGLSQKISSKVQTTKKASEAKVQSTKSITKAKATTTAKAKQ